MTTLWMMLAATLMAGCGSGDDSGFAWPDGEGDGGAGDAGSSDAGSGDAGSVGEQALVRAVGDAVVAGGGYVGTERYLLLPDGETDPAASLCTIRIDLEPVGDRDDCPDCLWAFDLQATDVEVEHDGRCGDAGLDADTLASAPRAYGYAEEYIGHSSVLMVELDGLWQGITYASWDETSGALSYDWDHEWISLE